MPSPLDPVSVQRQKFSAKGLDDHDLVTLLGIIILFLSKTILKDPFELSLCDLISFFVHTGAHTIGQTDCRFFSYRLYNFTTTGSSDPTINQAFLGQLQALCPKNGDGLRKVALDRDSPAKFDVSFFKNVRDGNGVLESDQRLWGDSVTRSEVQKYAGNVRGLLGLRFEFEFPKVMIKMSGIEVKTGSQGEIRKVCSRFN